MMGIHVYAYDEVEKAEALRPKGRPIEWTLLICGDWSASPMHSGYVEYYLGRTEDGIWLLEKVTRNACLEDVTEEDVEEGALNDDQLQALHSFATLEEAQEALMEDERESIVASWTDAPAEASLEDVGRKMLLAIEAAGEAIIEEPRREGLFDDWP